MAGKSGSIRAGAAFVELFTDDKQLQLGLAKAGKSVEELGTKIQSVGSGLQTFGTQIAGIGLAVAATMGVAVKEFSNFESAMAGIKANMPKEKDAEGVAKTTQVMGEFSKAVMDVSKSTGQGPTEIAQTFGELQKAGVKAEDGLAKVTEGVVKFSKVAGIGSEEAAVSVVKGMNVWKRSAEDVMDTMSAGADSSTVSLKDISDSAAQAGLVAAQSNMSFEEMIATIGMMGQVGVVGSDAGTAIKNMLLNLAAPTDEAKDLMKSLGIEVFETSGKMKKYTDIIAILQEKLGSLSEEEQKGAMRKIMGTDAIRPGLEIIKQGVDGLNKFKEAMADSRSVGEKYEIIMSGLEGSMTRLMSAVQRMAIEIGSILAPAVAEAVAVFSGFLKGMENLITANKESVIWLAKATAGVIAFGGALVLAGTAIKVLTVAVIPLQVGLVALGVIVSVIKFSFMALTVIIGATKVALVALAAATTTVTVVVAVLQGVYTVLIALLSPTVLVTAAFVALGVAAVALLAAFTSVFGDIWKLVKEVCGNIVETVRTAWGGISNALQAGDLELAMKIVWQAIKIIWQEGINSVDAMVDRWWISLVDGFKGIFFQIQRAWVNFWSNLEKNILEPLGMLGLVDMEALDKAHQKRIEYIDDEQRAAEDARRQVAAAEIAAGKAQVDEMKKGLADLNNKAAVLRDKMSWIKEEGLVGPPKPEGFDFIGPPKPEGYVPPRPGVLPEAGFDVLVKKIADAMKHVKDTTEARGTFSGFAAKMGLGTGTTLVSLTSEQNRKIEKQTEELKKVNKKLSENKALYVA